MDRATTVMSTIKPAIVILSETKDRIITVEILRFAQDDNGGSILFRIFLF